MRRQIRRARTRAIRLLSMPLVHLPEGRLKHRLRLGVLSLENTLPTELAITRGDTAVQVGTPSPRTLHRFRKAVGSAGRLVVFEAEPANFQRLKDAVARAGFDNVHLINAAAFSQSGTGEIACSPYAGDHKIAIPDIRIDNDYRPGNDAAATVQVDFVRLDEALPARGVERVDYLSVTVNGAELEVLRGATGLFAGSPAIRVYAKGHALAADGQPLNVHIIDFLRRQGFRTKLTRGELTPVPDRWTPYRAGDVYAWGRGP